MHSEFQELFALFDRDGSGSISERELSSTAHSVRHHPTEIEIDGALRYLAAFHSQKTAEIKLGEVFDSDPRGIADILSHAQGASAALATVDSLLLQLDGVLQPPSGTTSTSAPAATAGSFAVFLNSKFEDRKMEEELRLCLSALQLPQKPDYVLLSQAERTLSQWGDRLGKDEMDDILKDVEVLEDGTVSIDEWVRAIMLKGC